MRWRDRIQNHNMSFWGQKKQQTFNRPKLRHVRLTNMSGIPPEVMCYLAVKADQRCLISVRWNPAVKSEQLPWINPEWNLLCSWSQWRCYSFSEVSVCLFFNKLSACVSLWHHVAAADGRCCLFSDELTHGLQCIFSLVCLCVGDRDSSQCWHD